jgi:hypothetical protein
MPSDYVTSLIRTLVPVLVVSGLTSIATRFGLVFDEHTSNDVVVGITGLVISLYYAAVRTLERRWPIIGVLLGSSKKPAYEDADTTPDHAKSR